MLKLTVGGLEKDGGPTVANLDEAYVLFLSFHSSVPRLLVIWREGEFRFKASWVLSSWVGNTFFGGVGKFVIQLVL